MEKAHLTLYTVIGSPQHILTGIQSLFAPVIQSVDTEADQIRVTLQDDSLLVFHLSHVREKAGDAHRRNGQLFRPGSNQ